MMSACVEAVHGRKPIIRNRQGVRANEAKERAVAAGGARPGRSNAGYGSAFEPSSALDNMELAAAEDGRTPHLRPIAAAQENR
jgi:hypothetical protein